MLVTVTKYMLIKGTAVPIKIKNNNIRNNNNNNNNNNNTLKDESYQIPLGKLEGKKKSLAKVQKRMGTAKLPTSAFKQSSPIVGILKLGTRWKLTLSCTPRPLYPGRNIPDAQWMGGRTEPVPVWTLSEMELSTGRSGYATLTKMGLVHKRIILKQNPYN
jgi:hypothetical protein